MAVTPLKIMLGYGKPQTLEHVLRECGDNLTGENVMRQGASLQRAESDVLLPGITINTSPTSYSPIDQLSMMQFRGDHWVLFGELMQGGRRKQQGTVEGLRTWVSSTEKLRL
jgi:branched-chain amino acid transport system substrate-binding protein